MVFTGDLIKLLKSEYMHDCAFVILAKESSVNGLMYWCTLRKPEDQHGLYMHILERDAEVIGRVGEAEFNIYKDRPHNHGLLGIDKLIKLKYGE
jgi:hypothetical protein